MLVIVIVESMHLFSCEFLRFSVCNCYVCLVGLCFVFLPDVFVHNSLRSYKFMS